MSVSSPIQQATPTAGDHGASAVATAWLPQDLLIGILLRLPAGDLRRFRRVCKEWREIISNPAFIDDHMVHGPRTLTHTIVIAPGEPPCGSDINGGGFLFDERWRLKATFSARRSDEMVGQCNGLLCFLGPCNDAYAMYVVEPFSGESLTLPVNHWSHRQRVRAAYCFGFDPSSRRYKMFHQGQRYNVAKQDLFVYTIGVDDDWRTVQVAVPSETVHHGTPVFADGSVYWSVVRDGVARLARFDLATEQVTSESIGFLQVQEDMSLLGGMSTEDVTAPESITFVPDHACRSLLVKTEDSSDARVRRVMTMTLPPWQCLARPRALQRDHLVLDGNHGSRFSTHTITLASKYLGCRQLLLDTLKEERTASSSTRGLFVPVQVNQKPAAVATRARDNNKYYYARFFGYAPTVSPATLAHYLQGNI